jgi:hypothetical protein
MISKDLNSVAINDLMELKENKVNESKILEYKKDLKLVRDQDKKEFLSDISSFANTSGGDIIYGITESEGIPTDLDGMQIENIDMFKQQIENIIRDGLEPRISGYSIKEIEKEKNTYFLIIRVPKSWISPHRVIFKDSSKFYGRNSNGKYQLDVSELRSLFSLSDSISTKTKLFREERISKLISEETTMKLSGKRIVALHIIPLLSLSQPQSYDIKIINTKKEQAKPMCSGGWDVIYNFDGMISFNGHFGSDITSYTQFYRNGIIEAVTTKLEYSPENKAVFIPSAILEKNFFEALRNYFNIYKELKVDFPAYLLVSMINYKGVYLGVDPRFGHYYDLVPVDRDILFFPEVYIENSEYNFHSILRPIFDTLWNSCGFERCLNYDQNGSYNPK